MGRPEEHHPPAYIEDALQAETLLPPGVVKLWNRFDTLSSIPSNSGQETEMANHMINFAVQQGLEYEFDEESKTVLVLIPATKGHEDTPGTILQGHMDMVCLGEPNPASYGVEPATDESGEWVVSRNNTTLGADNRIGLSAMLALAEENISHGPLALLCTSEEETGLKGVMKMQLETDLTDYHYLINFDSEDEGEATISCAGGGDTVISLPLETKSVSDKTFLSISVDNLMGGHSGVEIGENRLSSVKVLAQTLDQLMVQIPNMNLVSLQIGARRNVIPSTGEVVIAVDKQTAEQVTSLVTQINEQLISESLHQEEKDLHLDVKEVKDVKSQKTMLTTDSSVRIIALLSELPHGVVEWSQEVDGLVQTSTNLATVNTNHDHLEIEMMTRSSVNTELDQTRQNIQMIAERYGASVNQEESYPGWPPQVDSEIINITRDAWRELTGEEMEILAIHAGLECGVIVGKYPHLEAISFGPTIKGAHSTKEKVNIASVTKFYLLARNVIGQIAQKYSE